MATSCSSFVSLVSICFSSCSSSFSISSIGFGGGVVARVQPIHAAMNSIAVIASHIIVIGMFMRGKLGVGIHVFRFGNSISRNP